MWMGEISNTVHLGEYPKSPYSNPEALQRFALSSHCCNLLKCPASKYSAKATECQSHGLQETDLQEKTCKTYVCVKPSFQKPKQLNIEHQNAYNFKFPEQMDVSRVAKS